MNKKDIKARVLSTLHAEQKAVELLKKSLDKEFFNAIDLLQNRKGKIIVTGVGKSSFVGMKIAATLTSLGHGAFFLNPMDALHGDSGMVENGDIVIALSFSGGTTELIKLVKYLKKSFKVSVVSITGNSKSTLAKISNHHIKVFVDDEGCPIGLAPMASTTASLVVGDLVASALTSPEIFKDKNFAKFHPAGSLGLSLKKVKEVMSKRKEIASVKENDLFVDVLHEGTKIASGIVAVINKNKELVGVVTDGDIRRILVKYDSPKDLLVKKIMTTKPRCIGEEDTLKDALSTMERFKITNLLVINEGKKFTGIVHIHNILEDAV